MKIYKEFVRYVTAIRRLSCLGRCQVALIIATLTTVFCILCVDGTGVPAVMRTWSPAFLGLTVLGVLFTVANENPYAFAALVTLLAQHSIYLILAMIQPNVDSIVRWAAIATNLGGFAGYTVLQLAARGTWGWHAYRAQLTSPALVDSYRRVQILHAALLLSIANSGLASLGAIYLPRSVDTPWLHLALLGVSALYAAVSGPVVAYCVHPDDVCGAFGSGALCVVAGGCTAYVGGHFVYFHHETYSEMEWISVCQVFVAAFFHFAVALTLLSIRKIFGSEVMAAIARAREQESAALIDATCVEEAISNHKPIRRKHPKVTVVRSSSGLNLPDLSPSAWTSDDDS